MYQNTIYICISWYKSWWFPVKKCWCQQNSRDVSHDFYIFGSWGVTVPSLIIVGCVCQILGRAGLFAAQTRKGLSWIGLQMLASSRSYWKQVIFFLNWKFFTLTLIFTEVNTQKQSSECMGGSVRASF